MRPPVLCEQMQETFTRYMKHKYQRVTGAATNLKGIKSNRQDPSAKHRFGKNASPPSEGAQVRSAVIACSLCLQR